jgi:Protein of unknown function (DUF3304)
MKRKLMALMCLVAAISACSPSPGESQGANVKPTGAKKEKTVPVGVTGYNHTDTYIDSFAINGHWGGNLRRHGGGGKDVCCMSLPDPWRPGIKVTVSWESNGQVKEREVEVPQYESKRLDKINAHFLRSGEVKVFATFGNLSSKDYPFTGEESYLKPGVPNFKLD